MIVEPTDSPATAYMKGWNDGREAKELEGQSLSGHDLLDQIKQLTLELDQAKKDIAMAELTTRTKVYGELLALADGAAAADEVTMSADIRWAVARSLADVERKDERHS